MKKLGVNIDHVATIREARKTFEPDPVEAAYIAEKNGADQITTHLREDRRHIQDRDLRLLCEIVQTRLNLEMAPTEEMVAIAKSFHPHSVTLVPEKREEITTEGGLNVDIDGLGEIISKLKSADIFVSLFIDPDNKIIKSSDNLGADAVELHTGYFANAENSDRNKEVDRIQDAAAYAKKQGLYVAAGHGITYHNVKFLNKIKEIEEYNIGHSIISRSVFLGMAEAVAKMKSLINQN